MTPEEREIKREMVKDQTLEAIRVCDAAEKSGLHSGNVLCRSCRRRVSFWRLYRCYFCGEYLCDKCAKVHFGDRPDYCGKLPEVEKGGILRRK